MSARNSLDPVTGPTRPWLQRVIKGVLLGFMLVTLLVFASGEAGLLNPPTAGRKGRPVLTPIQPDRVTLYYLSGNHPCAHCGTMSRTAEQVVATRFASERKSGLLDFRIDNFELESNAFFREECGVASATVLLVAYRQGQPARWKNLEGVWEHALSRESSGKYLEDETRAFLASSPLAAVGAANTPAPPGSRMSLWLASASAFGMGLLAAISPCALATNAVALAFLSQSGAGARRVLCRGAGYAAGRMLAYAGLGVALVSGLLATSVQGVLPIGYVNGLMGPGLILVSLFLFRLVRFNWSVPLPAEGLQSRAERGGLGWALFLGVVLALAFCPMAAALFFGGLLPLAVQTGSGVVLPAAFGLGTGLPVVTCAVLLALASRAVGPWFRGLRCLESGLRPGMATIFLGGGLYYSLVYVYRVW